MLPKPTHGVVKHIIIGAMIRANLVYSKAGKEKRKKKGNTHNFVKLIIFFFLNL